MATGLPSDWESQVLGDIGAPATAANISFMDVWQRREGGATANSCDWNPLNTTLRETDSWACNYAGVQAYTAWPVGRTATAQTLDWYPAIEAMLRTGQPSSDYPGVAKEFLKWSGNSYSWPGNGSSSSGGGSSSGGSPSSGSPVPGLSKACQAIVDRVNARNPPQIRVADNTEWVVLGCPGNLQAAVAYSATAGTGSAADIGSYDLKNLFKDVTSPFELMLRIFKFLFSIRSVEVIFGFALVLVGLAMLSRQLGGPSPPVVSS